MNCTSIRALLPALRDDDLAPDRRTAAEAHLAVCPDCAGERRRTDAAVDALAADPSSAPPRAHVDAVMAAVARDVVRRSERRPRRWIATHAAAAAAGLLLAWGLAPWFGRGGGEGGGAGLGAAEGGGVGTALVATAALGDGAPEPPPASGDGDGAFPARHGAPRAVLAVPVPILFPVASGPLASATPRRAASAPVSVALEPWLARGVAVLERLAAAADRAPSTGVGGAPGAVADARGEEPTPAPSSTPPGVVARFAPAPAPAVAAPSVPTEPSVPRGPVTLRRDGERITLVTRGEFHAVVPALLALLDDPDPAVVDVVEGRLRGIARDLDQRAPATDPALAADDDPWWRSERASVADRAGPPAGASGRERAWASWWRRVAADVDRSAVGF